MVKFIQRTGFVDNQKMWKSILTDMKANGFTLVTIDGAVPVLDTIPDALTTFVVEATATVDTLAATQPWRICVRLTPDSTEIYCATPSQITNEGMLAKRGVMDIGTVKDIPDYMGTMGYTRPKTLPSGGKLEDASEFFWHKGIKLGLAQLEGTMQHDPKQNLKDTDYSAMPFTYSISFTDHGVAFHQMMEGFDNDGCRQAWFVIQRAVDSTGKVVVDNKAPLFAVWSPNGGGDVTPDVLKVDGIRRMTIRESDVTAPSKPVSAVQHSADAFAVMNPLQQVPFSEDGKFDFRLPQGFNTHRHSYSYGIDMIGYASADVISNGVPIDVQVYGEMELEEIKKRRYRALSANSPNNTGMRLFMLEALDATAV